MVRPVATVKAMSLSLSKFKVSLVKEEISEDLFNKVPSKSKNIKSIQLVPSLSFKLPLTKYQRAIHTKFDVLPLIFIGAARSIVHYSNTF